MVMGKTEREESETFRVAAPQIRRHGRAVPASQEPCSERPWSKASTCRPEAMLQWPRKPQSGTLHGRSPRRGHHLLRAVRVREGAPGGGRLEGESVHGGWATEYPCEPVHGGEDSQVSLEDRSRVTGLEEKVKIRRTRKRHTDPV